MNEQELLEREEALKQKEQELEKREKKLDAFSAAMDAKKKAIYGKLPMTLKQVNTILYLALGALGIVVVLILLEALGIFKIGG